MIYPVVKFGTAVLETPAQPVTEFDEKLAQLVADMFESMYAAQGVGLAAPQIGISKQLAVIDITAGEQPDQKLVLVNPKILRVTGKQTYEEGCLSLPGFRSQVTRPKTATVRAQDVQGKWFEKTGEELLARAFCHEIDHLHGKLFIQHLSLLKRDLIKRKIRKRIREGNW